MTTQPGRVANGGRIDRSAPLQFEFNGRRYQGFAGDTLASALLANDVTLVARSFKYHRPRGIFTAGSEEPNALVTYGAGIADTPNTRATMIDLFDGLVARSQNAWPSVKFDIGALNNWLSPFFSAGFYYKTFMWPGVRGWLFYERFIRRAAGMGSVSPLPDKQAYERREAHCDVLVVGSGVAGIAAALTASRSGVRVLLVDEHHSVGGAVSRGLCDDVEILQDWVNASLDELTANPECTVLTRCSAFGYYDGNVIGLLQDRQQARRQEQTRPAMRHWVVRARQVVLATGSLERPLLFANNDLPGIMLASAARNYLREYAVCAGRRIVIATNNDSAYQSALDLAEHARVVLVDSRSSPPAELLSQCRQKNIELYAGERLLQADGREKVSAARFSMTGKLKCDLLLTSGGWTPTIHLHSQAGGKPAYSSTIDGFLPGKAREDWLSAGACNGVFSTRECLQEGREAAAAALQALDVVPLDVGLPAINESRPYLAEEHSLPMGKSFLDLQNDVTFADLQQGASEGYRSAELLKRYTTLGMGTDQGKTTNVNALASLAAQRGESIPAVGVTTFRPPFTPISIGAIAGRKQGRHILPTHYSPLHRWHVDNGAEMYDAGLWRRPLGYPAAAEDREATASREARHVRSAVAICDVSTLGKISVQGPDAAEFLERIYVNRWQSLPPGKARYGVMLRDDGFVFDDGTTSCLAEGRYLMTTTTTGHSSVLQHLEFHLQVTWPKLRVSVCDVTDQWCAIAVAGPRSRDLLVSVFGKTISDVPFMGVAELVFDGKTALALRVSFSGELGFEIYVPASVAGRFLEVLQVQGQGLNLQPYGLDAMDVLRIEKGHLTGAEIDGLRTLDDLGLGRMARDDAGFIGASMMQRPGLLAAGRLQLVGIEAGANSIVAGSHVVAVEKLTEPADSWGHVTSACFSPHLDANIALALVRDGRDKIGTTIYVTNPLAGTHVSAKIVSPHFFDPDGERLRD